jgi:magnesium-transporting ATPase (P-type)
MRRREDAKMKHRPHYCNKTALRLCGYKYKQESIKIYARTTLTIFIQIIIPYYFCIVKKFINLFFHYSPIDYSSIVPLTCAIPITKTQMHTQCFFLLITTSLLLTKMCKYQRITILNFFQNSFSSRYCLIEDHVRRPIWIFSLCSEYLTSAIMLNITNFFFGEIGLTCTKNSTTAMYMSQVSMSPVFPHK